MATIEAKCPSGLHTTVRGLKGRELDDYANKQTARKKNVLLLMCSSCTVEVHDFGPYEQQTDGTIRWGDVLVGDLAWLAICIRQATFRGTRDEEFAFKQICDECDHHFEWELDLLDLPTKGWDEEDRKRYRNDPTYSIDVTLIGYSGGPIIDGSYRITYRLLTGRDQKTVAGPANQEHQATSALLRRIVKVEPLTTPAAPGGDPYRDDAAPEVGPAIPRDKLIAWLGDLDFVDIDMIVESMDENDCGVDTTLDITCPNCGAGWPVELPFDDFWKRRRRSRSSSSSRT